MATKSAVNQVIGSAKAAKTRKLNLYVGLPIAALQGDEAAANQKAVQGFFSGSHTWRAEGSDQRIEINSVVVASQPVAAMFDYLLDDKGEMSPDKKVIFKKEIGILGIGMNTVDLLGVSAGAAMPARTAGKNAGVRRLLELSNQAGLYTLAEMDDQLRAGSLDLSTAGPIWSREVLGLIEQTWESIFKRFAAIVVVGGGVLIPAMRDALLKRFSGKAFIPDRPVLATARGLYKYALYKAAKSGDATEVLAFDAGFGNIKLFGSTGGLEMQSAVATDGMQALNLVGLKRNVRRPLHIENDRGSFYVGHGAHSYGRPVQNLDFDRLTGSPEMLALFHGALTNYFGA
jgi:hypothetical protein